MAKHIINDFWYTKRKEDVTEEKYQIVHTTSKLIIAEIRAMSHEKELYPDENSIADIEEGLSWIPKSLRIRGPGRLDECLSIY